MDLSPMNLENSKRDLSPMRLYTVKTLEIEQKFDRWLRVNGGDVQKAVAAIKQNEQWRLEQGAKKTLLENFNDVQKSFPYEFNGYDLEDRPVMISKFGEWDVNRNDERAKRYMIKWFESMEEAVNQQTEKVGRPVTQVTAIHDMTGFSMRFFTPSGMRFLVHMLRLYDDNYAGVMQKEYCINCPPMLSLWIALIKPFMAKETASHLRIFGTDREEWKRALEADIDPMVIERIFP